MSNTLTYDRPHPDDASKLNTDIKVNGGTLYAIPPSFSCTDPFKAVVPIGLVGGNDSSYYLLLHIEQGMQ